MELIDEFVQERNLTNQPAEECHYVEWLEKKVVYQRAVISSWENMPKPKDIELEPINRDCGSDYTQSEINRILYTNQEKLLQAIYKNLSR